MFCLHLPTVGSCLRYVEECEDCLSECYHFQAHLLLAKCYKGLSDLKAAISCCNSAIQQNSKWKEPYLYRSACFQALHVAFLETEGDTKENIERDRTDADIIVDTSREPTDVKRHKEEEAKRILLYTRSTPVLSVRCTVQ